MCNGGKRRNEKKRAHASNGEEKDLCQQAGDEGGARQTGFWDGGNRVVEAKQFLPLEAGTSIQFRAETRTHTRTMGRATQGKVGEATMRSLKAAARQWAEGCLRT